MLHKRNIKWPWKSSLAVDWTFNELAIRNPSKHSHLEYKKVAPSFFYSNPACPNRLKYKLHNLFISLLDVIDVFFISMITFQTFPLAFYHQTPPTPSYLTFNAPFGRRFDLTYGSFSLLYMRTHIFRGM